jgi:uncharacterized protein YjbI with pentapeptide repeats
MKPLPAPDAATTLLKKYAQGERDFSHAKLNECVLSGKKLPNIILRGADLNVANLSNANLSQGDFQEAVLNVSRLSGANLSQANLQATQMNVANLIQAILVGANLTRASLIRAEMLRADLSNTNLTQANLQEADLREVRLRWSNLARANLSRSNLRRSSLIGANLSNTQAHSVNLEGADLNNAVMIDMECRHGNLRTANLSGTNLRGANLRWANLTGANLKDADLTDAKLSGADLTGAQLEGATLENTILVHADLSRSNLRHARCVGADLSGATLTGIQLQGAIVYDVQTAEVVCDWIDLSPYGDQSQRRHFNTGQDVHTFLNQRPAQVMMEVDGVMNLEAHAALARIFAQLAGANPVLSRPPNIKLTHRHTQLSFITDDEIELPAIAYLATLPFRDGATIQEILDMLCREGLTQPYRPFALDESDRELHRVKTMLQQQDLSFLGELTADHAFFARPLQVKLINAHGRPLELYANPQFGVRPTSGSYGPTPTDMGRLYQASLESYLAFFRPGK